MSYVLLTDAPPYQTGGKGIQVMGRDWLHAMGPQVRLIIAPRALFGSDRAVIERAQPVPVRYYYELTRLKLGRLPLLRRCGESLLFLLVLPSLVRAVRKSGARRIFALSGAAPGFLFFAAVLARACGLPFDLSLVDDYEEFVVRNGQKHLVGLVRFCERRVLRRADRVFAISPGFVDHLREKYGQRAHWLPVTALGQAPVWAPFSPRLPDCRDLVFVGSVNFLYEQGLVDLARAIVDWNLATASYRLRLTIVTRDQPSTLLGRLAPDADFSLILDADDATRTRCVQEAWAVFLPYSFAPEDRLFVTTSFSYKFTDAIASGRPILVYGPAYASIPRHFREAGALLVATSFSELGSALTEIERVDRAETLERYARMWERHHSLAALRQVLDGAGSTGS